MPRRLIIGILVVLILGIVGGTIVLIVQQFRGDEVITPTPTPEGLTPAQPGSQQLTNPSGDDDADGLTNADEVLWGTITGNVDSDGDGYKDGEEVAANHNPTIPAPNDALPANFQPGQNVQPLGEAPLQVDQYFEENLDLRPTDKNLTEEYKREFPADQRTQENLITFASSQPIITKLPAVRESSFQTTAAGNPVALTNYADLAERLPAIVDALVLQQALSNLFEKSDPSGINGLATQARLFQQALTETTVPAEAVPLHKLLLGYSQLLAATLDHVALYPDDPVKGLVGLNQLNTIDEQYRELINGAAAQLR